MIAQLRTETFSMYREPIFERPRAPDAITVEENVERTARCVTRLR